MNMPGFTAEASLPKMNVSYGRAPKIYEVATVLPANCPSDCQPYYDSYNYYYDQAKNDLIQYNSDLAQYKNYYNLYNSCMAPCRVRKGCPSNKPICCETDLLGNCTQCVSKLNYCQQEMKKNEFAWIYGRSIVW